MRPIEIGEAVQDIALNLLATEPDVSWDGVACMRDWLSHDLLRYFTSNSPSHD
jgi:uncharacterized protein with HEPN domain